MRSLQDHGRHLLLPEINLVAPPPSPPSMVEPLWGTLASPRWSGLWPCNCVQQSLPLCGVNRVSPHGPVSIRQDLLAVLIEPVGRRLLPYTPWRYCRSIRPKHWETCTRVGTTWRFYMSCVLRWTSRSERRRWPHSFWVVRCPRLWSRSAISGCFSLTWRSRRRNSSWMLPCHRPASSATLSRAVPSSFRQHRSRLRRSNTSCAGGNPLLLPLRLQPLSLLVAVGAPLWPPPLPRRGSSLPPCGVMEPVTGRTPSPSRPPPNPAASASARGPETGDPEMEGTARREMVTAPLPPPEEGRVENPLFRFVFVPPLAQQPAVPKTSIKEQFPQSLGLKRRRVVYRASWDHFPPLSPGSGGLPKSTPPAHLWNRVRAVALKPPLQVVTRKPGSCVSPHEEESGECYTTHPDPAPCHHRPRAGSLCSTSLPHRGSVTPLVPLARSLASAPQSVSVAPTDHQTRLCDSVRPASPQVQGHPVHFSQGRRCSCLACRNRSPTGEGRDRAGPSSRYGVGVVQPLLHCAQERGYDRSWICEFWTVHFTSCRSRCWHRNAFLGAFFP